MSLQNRVRPDGSLMTSSARGMFTGNRGILHDPDTRTLNGKRWTTNAWICCSLEWKGRQRDVWGRNYERPDGTKGAGWSELFFLDEVTALAAGHRPCHTCRKQDADAFHSAFCAANGKMDAKEKNRLLHGERWLSKRTQAQRISLIDLAGLPDGTMIGTPDAFFALKGRTLLPWSVEGYGKALPLGAMSNKTMLLVTPRSIVSSLREGYQPVWHATAIAGTA